MNESTNYARGGFLVYEPGTTSKTASLVIPFFFNPETLARVFQVELGKTGSGTEGAKKPPANGDQGADAAGGTLKQTLTVQLRFDLDYRRQGQDTLPPELGILPEVCALEALLYPAQTDRDANSDGKEAVKARRERATVLFSWGERRILPVRITNMNVNETQFNAALNPTRAEIDVALEVLAEADAKSNALVGSALKFTAQKRAECAQLFASNAASQAGSQKVARLK